MTSLPRRRTDASSNARRSQQPGTRVASVRRISSEGAVSALAALASWALLAQAFPPSANAWLALLAWIPVLRRLDHVSAGHGAWLGWLTGVVACSAGFPWLLPALLRFQELSPLGGSAAFALFVAYHALPFAAFGAIVAAMRSRLRACSPALELAAGPAVASCWVALEWLFPKMLPWHLGDAFASAPRLRQSADLLGVFGLSYFAMLLNAWLAGALGVALPWRDRARVLSAAALVGSFASLYGSASLTAGHRSGRPLSLAVIQGGPSSSNAANLDEANGHAWETYSQLTADTVAQDFDRSEYQSGARLGLIVWPETVLRVPVAVDALYRARLEQFVERWKVPVLLGALAPAEQADRELNVAVLFNPASFQVRSFLRNEQIGTIQTYSKRHLLPFGEFVPGAGWIPPLRSWRTTGRFAAGEGRRRLWLSEKVALAPSICFEVLRPGAFLEQVGAGAGLLVNLSDDSWFASEAEASQHLHSAVLRAVEMRRWLVRAAGSGISAIIDPAGNIVDALPLHSSGVLRRTVEVRSDLTLYGYVGDCIVAFSVLNLFWFGLRVRSEELAPSAGTVLALEQD